MARRDSVRRGRTNTDEAEATSHQGLADPAIPGLRRRSHRRALGSTSPWAKRKILLRGELVIERLFLEDEPDVTADSLGLGGYVESRYDGVS